MKSKVNPSSTSPSNTPLSQRRLKTKPTLVLLALLLLGNLFWFVLWLLPSNEKGSDEKAATVDGEIITRQEWLAAIEERYGKETLQSLVNERVMEKAAKEYKIKVSEEEIDFEIALMRSAQDANDTMIQILSPEQLRVKIRSQLILEKVLTKDLIIEDEAVASYYKDNKALYNIPTTYRTSLIVVATKEEAEKVQTELKNGSEFSVLAREKSVDMSSASLGGDIGYVMSEQTNIDPAIPALVPKIKQGDISDPFVLMDGKYGIVLVDEIIEGKSFAYDVAKGQIKRQLAMEQLPATVNPEAFWSEFNATWFYGK